MGCRSSAPSAGGAGTPAATAAPASAEGGAAATVPAAMPAGRAAGGSGDFARESSASSRALLLLGHRSTGGGAGRRQSASSSVGSGVAALHKNSSAASLGSREDDIFDHFDFKLAMQVSSVAGATGGGGEMDLAAVRAMARGLAAGWARKDDEFDAQRCAQKILAFGGGDMLRQETALALLVPPTVPNAISVDDIELCYSTLGPSLAFIGIVDRCEAPALESLAIMCTRWVEDVNLSSTARSSAVQILSACALSGTKKIKRQKRALTAQILLNVLLSRSSHATVQSDAKQQTWGDLLALILLILNKSWIPPAHVWKILVDARFEDTPLAYKCMAAVLVPLRSSSGTGTGGGGGLGVARPQSQGSSGGLDEQSQRLSSAAANVEGGSVAHHHHHQPPQPSSSNNSLFFDPHFCRFVMSGLKVRASAMQARSPSEVNKLAFDILVCVLDGVPRLKDSPFVLFATLYSLLNDATLHLIAEPFKDVSSFFAYSAQHRSAPAQDYPWIFSSEWTSILFTRAFREVNQPDVTKLLLGRLLTFAFNFSHSHPQTLHHDPFPDWFLTHGIVATLDLEDLYTPSMFAATGAVRFSNPATTIGRFKKQQERDAARTEVQGFNLPNSLFGFLRGHLANKPSSKEASVLFLHLLKACLDLKTLFGVCTCMEALVRAGFAEERIELESEHFDLLKAILITHGGNGVISNRTAMLVMNILSLTVRKQASVERVLRMCDYVADPFLVHTSPWHVYWPRDGVLHPNHDGHRDGDDAKERDEKETAPRTLLELLGSPLTAKFMRDLMVSFVDAMHGQQKPSFGVDDVALLYSAWFAASRQDARQPALTMLREFVQQQQQAQGEAPATQEDFWFVFVSRVHVLTGVEALNDSTVTRFLIPMCCARIRATLYDAESDGLLETAWHESAGFGRASQREIIESLPGAALRVLRVCLLPSTGSSSVASLPPNQLADDLFSFAQARLVAAVHGKTTSLDLKAALVFSTLLPIILARGPSASALTGSLSAIVDVLCPPLEEAGGGDGVPPTLVFPRSSNRLSPSTVLEVYHEAKWTILRCALYCSEAHAGDNRILRHARASLGESTYSSSVMGLIVECVQRLPESADESFEALLAFASQPKSQPMHDALIKYAFSHERLSRGLRSSSRVLLDTLLNPSKQNANENLVRRFASHAFSASSPWAQHPSRAAGCEPALLMMLYRSDRVVDIMDFASGLASHSTRTAFVPGRFVDKEVTQICKSGKYLHPSAYVRFACLNWLDRASRRHHPGSASNGGGDDDDNDNKEDILFLQNMALLVCREIDQTLAGMSRKNTQPDTPFLSQKVKNLSFALVVLARSLERVHSREVVDMLCRVMRHGTYDVVVRQNVEMVLTRVIELDPMGALGQLEPLLVDVVSLNAVCVMSLLLCCSLAYHRVTMTTTTAATPGEIDAIILRVVFPWITCPKSSIRTLATNLCINAAKQPSDDLQQILSYSTKNPHLSKMMDKITQDQKTKSRLEAEMSLAAFFDVSEFNLLGELCPSDLRVDHIGDCVRNAQIEFFDALEGGEGGEGDEGGEDAGAHAGPPPTSTAGVAVFQKKIDSQPADLQHLEHGSARQDLVIVASFVERIPNLGGLSRTCEVFRARALVVNDAKVVNNPEFQAISVTSEKWLPIVEVKERNVAEYLTQLRREEGYVIVGLEQTTQSVALQDMEWPAHGRVCVVLGAEKTGIPGNILSMLDRTIEIPQFGMVKSLNVHVASSLIIWQYSEKMLAYGDEGASE